MENRVTLMDEHGRMRILRPEDVFNLEKDYQNATTKADRSFQENRDLRVKITKLEAELVDLQQLQEAVKHFWVTKDD